MDPLTDDEGDETFNFEQKIVDQVPHLYHWGRLTLLYVCVCFFILFFFFYFQRLCSLGFAVQSQASYHQGVMSF